ncbi:hypothetical protein PENSPDRAFT_756569 [Peniophora sp. CONT]|nr:hypothetical protein PENSPDRAFT_756569 [Peniophora sp. CONT]
MSDEDLASAWISSVQSRLSGVEAQHQLQTWDLELEAIQKAVSQARKLRNEKAWPRSLPWELWLKIFGELQLSWQPPKVAERTGSFRFGWMTITHVCSMWREIALNAPALWADLSSLNILTLPQRSISDILARSHPAPLVLYASWDQDEVSSRDLDELFSPSICQRIQSLSLSGPPSALERAISFLSLTTHHLLQLCVRSTLGIYTLHTISSAAEQSQLIKLSLTDCDIPRELLPSFQGLVRLSISVTDKQFRPAFTTLRHALSLPTLKELELTNVVPVNDTSQPPFPIIVLSETLRKLKFTLLHSSAANECSAFISCLHYPPQCSRGIVLDAFNGITLIEDVFANDASRILFPVPSGSRKDARATVKHLHVREMVNGGLIATVCAEFYEHPLRFMPQIDIREESPEGRVVNKIEIILGGREQPLIGIAVHLNLSTLRMRGIAFYSASVDIVGGASLPRQLHGVVDLRRLDLHVGPDICCELLEILSKSYESEDFQGTRVIFPNLEVIVWQFHRETMEDTSLAVAIVQFLKRRSEQGAPLHQVALPVHVSQWAVWNTIRTTLDITVTVLTE